MNVIIPKIRPRGVTVGRGRVTFRCVISSCSPMKRKYCDSTEPLQSKKPDRKMVTSTIQLSTREIQLRDLLLDVARYIDESKEIKDKIELRFAGGWVRDKILGIESHDIDTAINSMTGYSFSLRMREYLKNEGNLKKHSIQPKDLGNLHKILANPEKSKHLETATTKVFGFDVDFVNLRKETYSEDSRNPQMEFGTAQEDALRRDATINALFYNLHTDLVEDFAGGLEDMNAKRIRTPLEPYTTFMDDPLRVLRLIRFASRLEFDIDPVSEASMSNPSVMEALKLKISRERVGQELEKMLKGRNPRSALQLIDRLGLYSTIFTDPTAKEHPVPNTTNWHLTYDCLQELEYRQTPGSVYQSLVRSSDAKYIAWILAALTPWSAIPNQQPAKSGAKAPLPFATTVAREGIKADNKICTVITGAFRNYREITNVKDAIRRKDAYTYERDTLGMAIRRWDSQGGHWRIQVLFAVLVEHMNRSSANRYETLLTEWQGFIEHLEQMDLMDAASIKSLIDGTRLSKALNVKPGIWMKEALEVCIAWQLRNPGVTDLEGAIEEVKRRSIEGLSIPVENQ